MKGIFIIVIVFLASACADHEVYTVTLEVSCHKCTVTYGNNAGKLTHVEGIENGWTKSYPVVSGSFVALSAFDPGGTPSAGPEVIEIKIIANGAVLAEDKDVAYLPSASLYYNVP